MFIIIRCPHEKEQFAECGFSGAVEARDDTCFLERLAGGVKVHVDVPALALGDVQENLAHLRGLLHDVEEPVLGNGVAGAVCLYYDRPGHASQQDVADDLLGYAGVDLQYGHPCVQACVYVQAFLRMLRVVVGWAVRIGGLLGEERLCRSQYSTLCQG